MRTQQIYLTNKVTDTDSIFVELSLDFKENIRDKIELINDYLNPTALGKFKDVIEDANPDDYIIENQNVTI